MSDVIFQALIYSESLQEGISKHYHSVSASTIGVVFMDTTELGQATVGLEKYLAIAKDSEQATSDNFKEAQWQLFTLQKYVLISEKFRTVYVSARRSDAHRHTPTEVRPAPNEYFD